MWTVLTIGSSHTPPPRTVAAKGDTNSAGGDVKLDALSKLLQYE